MPEETPETTAKKPSPLEFLLGLPGAPSAVQIEELKMQVPGGRLRVFSPDGKRAFLLRGFSGLEMDRTQKSVPAGTEADREMAYLLATVSNCIVWTNATKEGKIDSVSLKACGAGLPTTLFAIVSNLSDYFDPESIEIYSGDI